MSGDPDDLDRAIKWAAKASAKEAREKYGEPAASSCPDCAASRVRHAAVLARGHAEGRRARLKEAALEVARHLVAEGFDEEDALAARDAVRALGGKG